MKEDYIELREKLFEQAKQVIAKGGVYNISGSELYADFVGSGGDSSKRKSYSLKGLKKYASGKKASNKFTDFYKSLINTKIAEDKEILNFQYNRDRINLAQGFIPNFATNWANTIQAYEESMAPAGAINLNTSTLGAIVGAGTGSSIKASGRVNKMGKTVTDSFPGLFGTAPVSSLGVVDPETGAAPPDSAKIQL